MKYSHQEGDIRPLYSSVPKNQCLWPWAVGSYPLAYFYLRCILFGEVGRYRGWAMTAFAVVFLLAVEAAARVCPICGVWRKRHVPNRSGDVRRSRIRSRQRFGAVFRHGQFDFHAVRRGTAARQRCLPPRLVRQKPRNIPKVIQFPVTLTLCVRTLVPVRHTAPPFLPIIHRIILPYTARFVNGCETFSGSKFSKVNSQSK